MWSAQDLWFPRSGDRTVFPGPEGLSVADIEGLEYERRSLADRRLFADQDLGLLVSIEVGDGELRKGTSRM